MSYKHGFSRRNAISSEYRAWIHIKERCMNPRTKDFYRWGGRGIKVCQRWIDSFENFLDDMGLKPSPLYTLDRVDNDGDYTPENCRWATWKEQERNRGDNVILNIDDKAMTISQWAETIGIGDGTLRMRLKRGWSVEKAIFTPVRSFKKC